MKQTPSPMVRRYIETLASKLTERHGCLGSIDYARLGEDHNTVIFKKPQLIYPSSTAVQTREGIEHHIFIPGHFTGSVEEFSTAHELGHVLLGHITCKYKKDFSRERKEAEADYFAERITDKRPTTEEIHSATKRFFEQYPVIKERYDQLQSREERWRYINAHQRLQEAVIQLEHALQMSSFTFEGKA